MLTTREISEMLKVSEETVRRWIRTGDLKAKQEDGKSYIVNEDDLIGFVEKKSKSTGTSIGKMASFLPGFVGAGAIAGEVILKMISKQNKVANEKSNKKDKEIKSLKEITNHIESLNRKKKKLELEFQMELLEIEEEISKYQQIKDELLIREEN